MDNAVTLTPTTVERLGAEALGTLRERFTRGSSATTDLVRVPGS